MYDIQWREDTTLRERYARMVHPSGLEILVCPKKLSTCYAILAAKYGSLDSRFTDRDGPQQAPEGVAHFLEHKLFAQQDGGDVMAAFAALGANADAYTANDRTAYLFSCVEHVEDALQTLLEFVTHPYFTEENVEKEKGIIAQEIGMYEDNPNNRLYYALLSCLYQVHDIRQPVGGSKASIQKITPEWLYRCYHAFYCPSNMVLVVCGNVTVEQVLAKVDALTLPQGERCALRLLQQEGAVSAAARMEVRMAVSRPMVAIGLKDIAVPQDPEARERRGLCMDLLNDLLFGKSGSFYTRLYGAGKISDEFYAHYESVADCAFNYLYAECDAPEALLQEVEQCLERAMHTPPPEEDFLRLQRCYYADYVRAFDSTSEIAEMLLDAAVRGSELFRLGELIRSITYGEVLALLQTFYQGRQLSMATVIPSAGE